MPVVDLTAHPTVTTPYGRWQPLNGPLGVAGFGISAIVCDPGEEFDIEHDETESGQQEAYIVVAGRGFFRIGDDEVEAGPGPGRLGSGSGGRQELRRARAGHPHRLHRRGACRRPELRQLDRRRRFGLGHARPATTSRKASISSTVL